MDTKEEIVTALKRSPCKIIFTKVNGDERVMIGTLSPKVLPELSEDKEDAPTNPHPNVVTLWDLEASDWRAFRVDSVIEFTPIQ